jgi:hypothetical protein
MRIPLFAALAVVCAAQAQPRDLTLKIPPVKTTLNIEGQPIEITAWGTVEATPSGTLHLAMTVDLGNRQENLTQLNQPERRGTRLSVQ